MALYRILSLDGGGVRGLFSAVILRRLQEEVPGWLEQVDLIAGTSTGGILALGLAHGLSPLALSNLYYEESPYIFDDSVLDDVADMGRLIGADYNTEPLADVLRRVIGHTRLAELQKKVLIAAFDLDNDAEEESERQWKPKFFHNFPGSDSDGHRLAYKVALYTSAAPTYFPSVDGYIDGGVVANNPSLAALAQTQDRRAELSPRPALHEIALFSLGTGASRHYVEGEKHDWGYAQWAQPLVNIILGGTMGVTDYQCRQLLNNRYHRYCPLLPQAIDLDDWQKRDDLIRLGERVKLQETVRWLEQYWC